MYSLTGLSPMDRPQTSQGPTQHIAVSQHDQQATSLLSPQNPLLWFGGVLAVTVGLVAVSGSVRLGRAKVSASVGKTGG